MERTEDADAEELLEEDAEDVRLGDGEDDDGEEGGAATTPGNGGRNSDGHEDFLVRPQTRVSSDPCQLTVPRCLQRNNMSCPAVRMAMQIMCGV